MCFPGNPESNPGGVPGKLSPALTDIRENNKTTTKTSDAVISGGHCDDATVSGGRESELSIKQEQAV